MSPRNRRRVEAAVTAIEPWLRTDAEAGKGMGEPGAVDVVDRAACLRAIREAGTP